ncbi:hypothetical protein B566_EDAN007832 [Ephemera danica]|nr:hypothetical protein B566_EDAN007832 [Ephemera danica]
MGIKAARYAARASSPYLSSAARRQPARHASIHANRPPLVAALLLGLVALSAAAPRPDEQDYEYDEDEEAPPPPPPSTAAPARSPISRGRITAPRKPVSKKATESTTAAPPPPPSPENSEEQEDSDSPDTTTTEAPKKYLIAGRNGVVRPFRSNDDLIAALKRRRQSQVSTHSPLNKEESATTAAPPRQSKSQRLSSTSANINGKRGRFGNTRVPEPTQEVQEVQPAPTPRRGGAVFPRRPAVSSRRVQEEVPVAEEAEETQREEVQTPRPNRFTPRRRS